MRSWWIVTAGLISGCLAPPQLEVPALMAAVLADPARFESDEALNRRIDGTGVDLTSLSGCWGSVVRQETTLAGRPLTTSLTLQFDGNGGLVLTWATDVLGLVSGVVEQRGSLTLDDDELLRFDVEQVRATSVRSGRLVEQETAGPAGQRLRVERDGDTLYLEFVPEDGRVEVRVFRFVALECE